MIKANYTETIIYRMGCQAFFYCGFRYLFYNAFNYAVFDIREAPAHIKNMKVIFSPRFNFQLAGQDSEEIFRIFNILVRVLHKIFNHVVDLSKSCGVVKIYSETQEVGYIFTQFAKELKSTSPDYIVKMYSKWIEITNSVC